MDGPSETWLGGAEAPDERGSGACAPGRMGSARARQAVEAGACLRRARGHRRVMAVRSCGIIFGGESRLAAETSMK